jgi:hypothetical protein
VLAALPVPFDDPQLVATSRVMNMAGEAVSAAKASYVIAVRDAQSLEGLEQQARLLVGRRSQVAARISMVETELGGLEPVRPMQERVGPALRAGVAGAESGDCSRLQTARAALAGLPADFRGQ